MSTVRWGRAVCPPGPRTTMSTSSTAAVMAPVLVPTCPAGRVGSQWSATAWSTPSRAPSSMAKDAPPGTTSSAGWNSSLTFPGKVCPMSRRAFSASPAPSTTAACTSCPQAWHAPGTLDLYETSFSSSTGRASMSARRRVSGPGAPPSRSATSPLLESSRGSRPAVSSLSARSRVVRTSFHEVSGWACRSRRNATSSASSPRVAWVRASSTLSSVVGESIWGTVLSAARGATLSLPFPAEGGVAHTCPNSLRQQGPRALISP